MLPERRAVLFDLDDTLYPLQQFLLSGFRAVAARVAQDRGHEYERTLGLLIAAYDSDRGRELDVLAHRLSLPAGAVAALVDVIRTHQPDIRLSAATTAVLMAMRRGWRIGVVTNGRPDIQARKITALGLSPMVDAIVFAAEHGSGAGKPDAEPFLEAARVLGVGPEQTVFVGDDQRCDIAGAQALGMSTIWLPTSVSRRAGVDPVPASLVLSSLSLVPEAAARLVASRRSTYVA